MSRAGLPAEARGSISADRLWEDLETLIRWERYTGTEGEEKAAQYVSERLEAEGIPVVLHRFEAYISLPGPAGLEVLGPEPRTLPCTTHCFGAPTGPGGVEGDVVLVDGKNRPAAPLEGKIALVDGLVAPGRFYNLERQGAIAQVYANTNDVVHELTVSTIWGTPTPETAGRLPATPVGTLPRSAAVPLLEAARAGRPLRVRLRAEVDTRWRSVGMPEAQVSAEGGEAGFVLAGGHLDSWYFGAMDNAAGNAVLMELARVFQKLRSGARRDLRVVLWVGHSHGRFSGSTWYLDNQWDRVRRGCGAYLNIDQPGFRHGRVWRPFSTADIAGWVRESVREEGGQDVAPNPPRRNADQSFWGLGVPSFSFLPGLVPGAPDPPAARPESGFPWYWHHPDDTLDKIDREVLTEHARVYAASLADLLARPVLPLDPAALGEAIQAELEGIAGEAGAAIDLEPARGAAGRFVERAGALRGRLGSVPGARAEEVNRSLLRISHLLNSVLYTSSGPYTQDPAAGATTRLPGLSPARRLPSLADKNERGFLLTRLVRERNRLVDALEEGREEVERALGGLAG